MRQKLVISVRIAIPFIWSQENLEHTVAFFKKHRETVDELAFFTEHVHGYIPIEKFAVHLGLNPIYLIGCDHSYPGEVNVVHGQKVVAPTTSSHFLPNYRQPGEIVNAAPIEVMNEAFQCAREYAESHGIRILNATRGGKLEVFERCDLDSLI